MISWLPHEIITRHTRPRTRGRRTAPLTELPYTYYTLARFQPNLSPSFPPSLPSPSLSLLRSFLKTLEDNACTAEDQQDIEGSQAASPPPISVFLPLTPLLPSLPPLLPSLPPSLPPSLLQTWRFLTSSSCC